jgi:sensor histidine kinase YesM
MAERRFSVRVWSIALGVWTSLAVLSVLQTALYLDQHGQPIAWPSLVGGRLLDWYTCFAFAPAYVWLIRRHPFDVGARARSLTVILAATIAFVFIKYGVLHFLAGWIWPTARSMTYSSALATNFFTETLFLGGIALAIYALELNRRVQHGQVERIQLARDLAEARLSSLSLQLQPHFLFNTMNSAIALIVRHPDAAEDMLTDLCELLQDTLRDDGHEVPLDRELEFLDSYLRIMRRRFGDALSTVIEVDSDVRHAPVPKLLLQPLVENAIEHGLAACAGKGRVVIRASALGERVRIVVADDGAGFVASERRRTGVGLDNTARRLEQLYGLDHRFLIESGAGPVTGTTVTIEIPRRTPTPKE